MKRRQFITLFGGAAAAWPVAAGAQAMPVIGFMNSRSSEDAPHVLAAFRQGLSDIGLVEGQNVAIEFRWADGQTARLPSLAADLVARRVAVLAAFGGEAAALAAKQATSTIPVVFGTGDDPVQTGLVESFNRPGGNATGYTILTGLLEPKRIGLLRELVPGIALLGILANRESRAVRQLHEIENASRKLGQSLFVALADNDTELDAAFGSLTERRPPAAASLMMCSRRVSEIGAGGDQYSAQSRLPAIYHLREYAFSGGLISYGPRITDLYHQAGMYVGRILKGAKPADRPVLQPTRFDLVINLKTATALGIVVPNAVQLLADEVIE